MSRTYYYESKANESKYLRNEYAHIIADVWHASPDAEIGVIIDPEDGSGLEVRAVEPGGTIEETTRNLANA